MQQKDKKFFISQRALVILVILMMLGISITFILKIITYGYK